jgi:hypothetical protein
VFGTSFRTCISSVMLWRRDLPARWNLRMLSSVTMILTVAGHEKLDGYAQLPSANVKNES